LKRLAPLFLNNHFFYALAGVFLLYCLAFVWFDLRFAAGGLLIVLFAFTLFDFITLKKAAQQVQCQRMVPKHFSMSDNNPVNILIHNTASLELRCRIIDELPYQLQLRNFELHAFLLPATEKRVGYEVTPLGRGEYHFGMVNLFLSTKLGLVNYRKKGAAEQMVKVYPSFIQMKLYELMVFSADSSLLGMKKTRKIGHGYEYSDIRDYVVGDDTRTLNWKASSRAGKLMVNNYEDEKAQQVYALINKSRVMRMPFNGLSLMDYAINATLAILNIALKNHDQTGLLTFAKEMETFIPAGKRSNQLQLLRNALYNEQESRYEENYQELFQSTRLKIKRRSLLLMFTNFMSINSLHRVLPEIKKINKRHLLVVIFFENSELEAFKQKEVSSTLDIASKVMAQKLSEEMNRVVYELRNAGVQTLKTKAEDLTANTIGKYLELKSMGMI
jgi:uncharacterized protein (DUF58 family)